MPKDETLTIRSHEKGTVAAYVTYPHWRAAKDYGVTLFLVQIHSPTLLTT